VAVAAGAQDTPSLNSQKEKLSYALGMDLGKQLQKQSVDVDPTIFSKGFSDGLSGGKTLLTDEEVRAAISELQGQLKQKEIQATKSAADENQRKGDTFLSENEGRRGDLAERIALQNP
jgi:FKBP-type peptidyl-prolyl cis-trans isomerase